MTVLGSQWLANAGGVTYEIPQSCRFNDGDSPELSRTYALNSPWTLSAWLKRGELGAENLIIGASGGEVHFNSNDTLEVEGASSTAVFRDTTAWYHIHASDNGLYVNGVLLIAAGSLTTTDLSNAKLFDDFDGYVAEVHLQAGTSAYTNFGTVNDHGVWTPKSATSGDTYLEFADSSDFGVNSGTTGAWTASGLVAADQVDDTPTKNYATLSPIGPFLETSGVTGTYGAASLSDGNLFFNNTASNYKRIFSAFAIPKSGKWAFQAIFRGDTVSGSGNDQSVGIFTKNTTDLSAGTEGLSYKYAQDDVWLNGTKVQNGTDGSKTVPATIEYLIDVDSDSVEIILAGSSKYTATSVGLTNGEDWFPFGYAYANKLEFDFGQTGYVPSDSDYLTLNTANLPAPAIKDPSEYFQITLYDGDGSTQSINQDGNSTFQPDWVWIKNRDTTDQHSIFDVARGVTEVIGANATTAEVTNDDTLTGFESDGFALGDDVIVNTNTESYVAWQWKTQGGAGSSNTDGSINTTTTSVNTTAGFSISTFAGTGANATVGHGLGLVPKMILLKNRTDAQAWVVYHVDAANTHGLTLNDATARADDATFFNDTTPTASVFSIGSNNGTNGDGDAMVAYCFAEIPGYSKFSSFIGNASAEGPFIHLGFSPAWFMWKNMDSGTNGDWIIMDSKRDPFNQMELNMMANRPIADDSGEADLDFCSSGVKNRGSGHGDHRWNKVATFIYMAFAEHPFGGAGVAPATAR